MKAFLRKRVLFSVIGSALAVFPPVTALAHPGHDHSDLPSVVRHPFLGWEHASIVLLMATVVILAIAGIRQELRASSERR